MNRRGIGCGRFGGVPVTIGLSWLAVVPLVAVALFAGIPPHLGSGVERGAVAVFGTVLLFASVLMHELGHAVVARRRGIRVDRVVVFLFGGYSEMDLDQADPSDDIAISVAGPAASALLAAVMIAIAVPAPEWAGSRRTLALLGLVNAGVAVFNLLPGFPLDGGRIVRAALIEAGFDSRRAQVVTSRLGVALGGVAIAVGVWMSVRGEVGSIVAVPVGVLVVVIAAAAHPRRVQRAGDLMHPLNDPVAETEPMSKVRGRPGTGPIPVVAAGRVIGFVMRGAAGLMVAEAMESVGPYDIVEVDTSADEVRKRIAVTGRPVAVAYREKLVGVVEPDAVSSPPVLG